MKSINLERYGNGPITLDDVAAWAATDNCLMLFAEDLVSLCDVLSRRLLQAMDPREYPEVGALAFWLRRASIVQLRKNILGQIPKHVVLVPRGIALHFPPTNVDTVFVYSWALSFLVGNRNLIRLSRRHDGLSAKLAHVLGQVLAESDSAAVRSNTLILAYDHDDATSTDLSALADLRIVWGGDDTVNHMRALPLPPLASEVVFPSRTSLAVLSAGSVLALEDAALEHFAQDFYEDVYAFDQLACSSPRRVVWLGDADEAGRASRRFFTALASVVAEKNYALETATVLSKLTLAAGGLADGKVDRLDRYGNAVTVMGMTARQGFLEEFCGGGLFEECRVQTLAEVASALSQRNQTLTHFGLSDEQLRTMILAAGNAAPDRVVPVGEALSFSRYWDGMDLIQVFTRSVHVVGRSHAESG
ncbi:MAG: gamma-glutamyl phosphate reductase [Rhizobiales bacterium]|nr:gamma-glutamyl phosphate reductase [Hyphomicrobiales bacterium]